MLRLKSDLPSVRTFRLKWRSCEIIPEDVRQLVFGFQCSFLCAWDGWKVKGGGDSASGFEDLVEFEWKFMKRTSSFAIDK